MTERTRVAAVAPPEGLRGFVAGAWRVDTPTGHAVHTSPSNEAFDGVLVGGPLRTFMKRELVGETRVCGVSVRPGFGALFGVSAKAPNRGLDPACGAWASRREAQAGTGLDGLFRPIARLEKVRFDARVGETIAHGSGRLARASAGLRAKRA
jgi:hypothetical protein